MTENHGPCVCDACLEDARIERERRAITEHPTRPPHPERIPGTGRENGLGITGLPKPRTSTEHPTDAMIDAGVLAWLNAGGHDCDSADLVGPIYLAMNAARTTPIDDEGLVEKALNVFYETARLYSGDGMPIGQLTDAEREPLRICMRAAIEAIREPNVS